MLSFRPFFTYVVTLGSHTSEPAPGGHFPKNFPRSAICSNRIQITHWLVAAYFSSKENGFNSKLHYVYGSKFSMSPVFWPIPKTSSRLPITAIHRLAPRLVPHCQFPWYADRALSIQHLDATYFRKTVAFSRAFRDSCRVMLSRR